MAHGGGKRCSEPGCGSAARGGGSGLCKKHGGGLRCCEPGCDRAAQDPSTRCKAHGGGYRCADPAGCKVGVRGPGLRCEAHGGEVAPERAAVLPRNYHPPSVSTTPMLAPALGPSDVPPETLGQVALPPDACDITAAPPLPPAAFIDMAVPPAPPVPLAFLHTTPPVSSFSSTPILPSPAMKAIDVETSASV